MQRDIRDTDLYREVEEHFRRSHEPAFGRISGAVDLSPSPDGRVIAFSGTKLEKLEGTPASRICLLDLETRRVSEITSGPNDDRSARWWPDGSRLAFLSDRAERGRFQLHLLDRDRIGEAHATPRVEGSIEYLDVSPDGSAVLIGAAEEGAERAGGEGSGRIDRKEELSDWMPMVSAEDGWRRLHVHDVASGTTRAVSREGLNVWEAAWCGPGSIAAIVSDDPSENAWYEAALALVDVSSGAERELYRTGRADRQIGHVVAAPSGERIALVRSVSSDRGWVEGDVLLVDPSDGAVVEVDTSGADVSSLTWRDDDRLLYVGLRHLDAVVGEIEASSGAAKELWSGPVTLGGRHSAAAPIGANAWAAVIDAYDRPPGIAVAYDGDPETIASFEHDGTLYLTSVAGRLERVTWEGPGGLEIEGLLAVPPGDGPHPMVLHVHGGPIGAFQHTWGMGYALTPLLVARGYAVLHANPRGSTGRGEAFQAMVIGDMGGDDAEDLLAGVEAMVSRGVADPARLGVYGGSYGGFMSTWLVSRTDRFAAAVAISPVTDWYSQHWTSNIGFWDRVYLGEELGPGGAYFDRSPVMAAARVRTPTLLTAGAEDRCTPPGQAIEFHQALREHGVASEVAIYPGEGHGVRKLPGAIDLAARVVGWFEQHMPAKR